MTGEITGATLMTELLVHVLGELGGR